MGQVFRKHSGTGAATKEGDTSAHDSAVKAATGGRWGHDTQIARKSGEVQAALAKGAEPAVQEARNAENSARHAAQGGRW
ncbi:hypothetical protein ACKKBG_A06775 [Auxenochlorella protothecoides x Auxenochlorella symbiontica]